MTFLIRDKVINVYSDGFELIGLSWISKLDSKEVFSYKDIKKINYDKRFTVILKGKLKETQQY